MNKIKSCDMSLSDDDKNLFRNTIGEIRKIENDRVEHERRPMTIKVRQALPDDNAFDDMMSDDSTWLDFDPDMEMKFARPGVQRRLLRQLVRGQIEPDAGIDLHGLTVAESRDELSDFIYLSLKQNFYCVKIIHGQGYNSPEGPIIRGFVNKWLRLRQEVLAFTNAPRQMGGRGATLCILRSMLDEF